MHWIAKLLIALVALEHFYILYMEMFSWERLGKRTFRGALPDELFAPTRVMAANQGLYNGFLASGLIWSLLIRDPQWSLNIALFFLGCVVVAGLYGGWSASRKIIWTQALPAAVAMVVVLLFGV